MRDLRLIARAARENEDLTAALMVRQALVEPALSVEQMGAMPAGLMQFLLREVNRISGITAAEDEILAALEDPLVKASLHAQPRARLDAGGDRPADHGRGDAARRRAPRRRVMPVRWVASGRAELGCAHVHMGSST